MSRAIVLSHWNKPARDVAPPPGLSAGTKVLFAWLGISVFTAVVGTTMTAGVPQTRLERTVAQNTQTSNHHAALF